MIAKKDKLMKKLILLLMAFCLLLPFAEAQNRTLEKARQKEYKTKIKEYKKEGWKLFGSSRSLDVALLSHYDRLNNLGEDGREVVGIAAKFKSKNVGKQMAAIFYDLIAGSSVMPPTCHYVFMVRVGIGSQAILPLNAPSSDNSV